MSKTLRKHSWDFSEKEIPDGIKYGHDSKKLCEHCRSDRMNKRNLEAYSFGGRAIRCLCEKIRLTRIIE